MTKDQFDVLVKAKNIMLEQVVKAIQFLKDRDVKEAIEGLYQLYLATHNNNNTKASNLVMQTLMKYLPQVQSKEHNAIILLVQATNNVDYEKYNDAISVYYEYKKLELNNAKFDYLFDSMMLDILYENRIYNRYKKLVQSLIENPYMYEIDGYYAALLYYKDAIISIYTNDTKEITYCLRELNKIVNSNRHTEYHDKCEVLYNIIKILAENYLATSLQDRQNVIKAYKEFIDTYLFDTIIYDTIEAQIIIINTLIKFKEYNFAIERLNSLLTYRCSNKIRLKIYQQLSQCYKELNDNRYYETLEAINSLLINYIQFNEAIVNEGLLNSIKFYDTQLSYTEIKKQYEIDNLTGCYSRNVFYKRTLELFNEKNTGTILFFDLNNLKETNDLYSHSTGDEYLKTFTKGIFELIDESYQFFRYGGDEFILITSSINKVAIDNIISKITEKFNQVLKIATIYITIKYSAGVAFYPEHGETIDEVIRKADRSMYDAKNKGGGFRVYQGVK